MAPLRISEGPPSVVSSASLASSSGSCAYFKSATRVKLRARVNSSMACFVSSISLRHRRSLSTRPFSDWYCADKFCRTSLICAKSFSAFTRRCLLMSSSSFLRAVVSTSS
eukprot:Mycagemm_TRINITY_DN10252_c0_g2::TRINITY_DN10252_c0_g2_i1::g.4070::m.4070 type:complete len:110 gc:universal TRINITY_DN10252_c0_g2_i1:360-31(-)